MTPTADTLALEFNEGLHACLGAEKMREVVERNRVETAPSCCHSHDFRDANMVLYEVVLRHGMTRRPRKGWSGTAPCGTRRGTWLSRGSFESLAEVARVLRLTDEART